MLSAVAASIPGAMEDWDQGAGEDWARCLRGETTVAYVGMKWPILILLTSLADVARNSGERVEIILVESMDASNLSVAAGTLERFAGRRPPSNVFNPSAFCADELVWLTV